MSDILRIVHETAKGLEKSGLMDEATIREFDLLCLANRRETSAEEVNKSREYTNSPLADLNKKPDDK